MTPVIYVCFGLLTILLISVDIWQTRSGRVSITKAAIWSAVWFILAFVFAATIYFYWDLYAPTSTYSANKAMISFITGL